MPNTNPIISSGLHQRCVKAVLIEGKAGHRVHPDVLDEVTSIVIYTTLRAVASGMVDLTAQPWLSLTPTAELERRVDEFGNPQAQEEPSPSEPSS